MYLYGASGHGKVVKEILDDAGIEVKAFIDDDLALSNFFGLPVLHSADKLDPVIVSIGKCDVRRRVVERLKCSFATAIHSSAVVSPSAKIGEGSVVMQGAVVQADAQIGGGAQVGVALGDVEWIGVVGVGHGADETWGMAPVGEVGI